LDDPAGLQIETPAPGILSARAPLAWSDSLAFRLADGGAWNGYDATLARASTERVFVARPRTRSTFSLLNGAYNLDETGLRIERGDSSRTLAVETASGTHGERGALGVGGKHLWGASGRWRRGAHALDMAFTQRGAADRLRGGEEETAAGESGHLGYRVVAGSLRAGMMLARGHEVHRSFLPDRDTQLWSRRDAQTNRVAADAELRRDGQVLAARVDWSGGRVRRDFGPAFDRRASATWAALRWSRPTGEGTLDIGLGAGHHDALGGVDLAPSAGYRFAARSIGGRFTITRLLTPVWSDLVPGDSPYLQRTWVTGSEVFAGNAGSREARAGFWMGRSADRAIVTRAPIEEEWLRDGFRRDPVPYDFGLLFASASWSRSHAGLRAEGFALARDRSASQPWIDPGSGGRAAAEWRFRAFQGDLGVILRAEAEAIGPRETEAPGNHRLPGEVSFGASAVLTLGDAIVTLRGRNLENNIREETWIDHATGLPARGVGRELRLALVWPLFN
jgi:hypothetical protein